ncbi:putative hydrolases of HD superfamily [Abditibacterium utsteinense]|uniref:Putative hydrolases of HD superfamily n=1 Tax=Abditibacterium utsteinense TaxID=1960156 RepID=A0A2S8SPN2_9BACT|nr:putative hydrolases of HD superfamily [Abditibacterium utsteinense]
MEADRLKSIARRTYISDNSRRENSAEHSWHFALGVLLLREYGSEIDTFRALQMAIIHDLVEIDAGDTFAYDTAGLASKTERENAAADRLFGMLPDDQKTEFRALWQEFESNESAEAKFALAIDRLCPILLNYTTGGRAWRENGVSAAQVVEINGAATNGAPEVQKFIAALIRCAIDEEILPRE